MINLKRIVFLILLIHPFYIFSQEITLDYNKTPLNQVVVELHDTYDLSISFDDHLLSSFLVTDHNTYSSPDEALISLIKLYPLQIEKNGNVYIIFKQPTPEKPRYYTIAGQVLDAQNKEPLPYSHIIINGYTIATDVKGNFSLLSDSDSIFYIKASHLGFYILDTVLYPGTSYKLVLKPSSIGLSEVVITSGQIEKSTQIGSKPGLMKLNHQVAHFLPGYGDNSVFNLLRLMPGIVAAGEQTNDLIIWGSYAGQSQVLFDEFTIYGLKNFNDNISAFNPLLAKDIEVYKGGYDAKYGERVGGIVNIVGKTGDPNKFGFTVNINNMTMNAHFKIPLFKKASLQIAFRHTYYNLYNPNDMNFLIRQNSDADSTNDIDVNVVPDYTFRDLNIKYAQKFKESDLFYISLYVGNDDFKYSLLDSLGPYRNLNKSASETNTQSGATAFYGRTWRNGSTSNFTASFSKLDHKFTDQLQIEIPAIDSINQKEDRKSNNILSEFKIKADNRNSIHRNHTLEWGGGLYTNRISLAEDTFNIDFININDDATRYLVYLQDYMSVGKKVILKAGLRYTHAFNLKKVYLDPRVSVSYRPNDLIKINAAWGIYSQFITQSSVVDALGNYRYFWAICNNEEIPVLKSNHTVLGASFHKKSITFSLEGYYKYTDGITRYISFPQHNIENIVAGISRSYGMDVFLQGSFKKHAAWVAYSLSKTEEYFNYYIDRKYHRAPQDQRHEVKLALLLNFDPFYFSSNYVYGSGFPFKPATIVADDSDNLDYSRLDVSFIYKFLDRKMKGEIGLSILNVLNTQNIKYTNFERVPATQQSSITVYAEAIPFTPTLYFKIAL